MKKTIRIDFRGFWWYLNPEDNFFTNLLKKDYNVVIDKENPDYVFFSVYGQGTSPSTSKYLGGIVGFLKKNFNPIHELFKRIYYFKRERWKMPILEGKFIKIFFTVENGKPDMNKCDWAFSFVYDEELKNPRHLRLPAYVFNTLKNPNELIKKNINTEKIRKEKTRFCAFIYTHSVPFRNRFFKRLCKYKKVESWGKVLNNMGEVSVKEIEKNSEGKKSGTMRFKSEGLIKPYKFLIVFENSSVTGYTTQTPVEAMLADCVPIYWGNSLVSRDFNTKSFVNYNDFEIEVRKNIPEILFKIPIIKLILNKYTEIKASNKMIKRIIEIDKDDKLWEEYAKQPWYPDNKPTKYVDYNSVRMQLRKIFG